MDPRLRPAPLPLSLGTLQDLLYPAFLTLLRTEISVPKPPCHGAEMEQSAALLDGPAHRPAAGSHCTARGGWLLWGAGGPWATAAGWRSSWQPDALAQLD